MDAKGGSPGEPSPGTPRPSATRQAVGRGRVPRSPRPGPRPPRGCPGRRGNRKCGLSHPPPLASDPGPDPLESRTDWKRTGDLGRVHVEVWGRQRRILRTVRRRYRVFDQQFGERSSDPLVATGPRALARSNLELGRSVRSVLMGAAGEPSGRPHEVWSRTVTLWWRSMADDSMAFLDHAAEVAVTDPIELTVRELIAHWGAKRRGVWVVDRIEEDLAAKGLTTEPLFADAWIDGPVRVVAVSRAEAGGDDSAIQRAEGASPSDLDISLRVGSLPSANTAVVSVPPDATLTLAQSLMLRYDYSQLAVMSGERELRGAISWESIAQAQLRDPRCSLARALIRTEPVELDDDLLSLIPRIVSSGFVFVRASDRRLSGIVTMADLSLEFSSLATPFFLLGEIERRLRRKIDQCFESGELERLRDSTDSNREVAAASDLTFGEYGRLIQSPENWARLGWAVDRNTFNAALDEVRQIRNEVMHFSPDQLEGWQVDSLKNFIRWLRILEPS